MVYIYPQTPKLATIYIIHSPSKSTFFHKLQSWQPFILYSVHSPELLYKTKWTTVYWQCDERVLQTNHSFKNGLNLSIKINLGHHYWGGGGGEGYRQNTLRSLVDVCPPCPKLSTFVGICLCMYKVEKNKFQSRPLLLSWTLQTWSNYPIILKLVTIYTIHCPDLTRLADSLL
jgi:hypothetical protein